MKKITQQSNGEVSYQNQLRNIRLRQVAMLKLICGTSGQNNHYYT